MTLTARRVGIGIVVGVAIVSGAVAAAVALDAGQGSASAERKQLERTALRAVELSESAYLPQDAVRWARSLRDGDTFTEDDQAARSAIEDTAPRRCSPQTPRTMRRPSTRHSPGSPEGDSPVAAGGTTAFAAPTTPGIQAARGGVENLRWSGVTVSGDRAELSGTATCWSTMATKNPKTATWTVQRPANGCSVRLVLEKADNGSWQVSDYQRDFLPEQEP